MSKQSPGMDGEEDATSGSKEMFNVSDHRVNDHESTLLELVRASPHQRAVFLPPSRPSETPLVAEKEECEYGCKYCNKKFSNQQALGGHQNGHKLERTIERNLLEGQVANFGYMPGGGGGPSFFPGMNSPPRNFTGSLIIRSQRIFKRAIINSPYFPQHGRMQYGMTPYGRAPYYPGRPRHVLGNVSKFMARPAGSSCLENRPPGIQFSPPRSGTRSSFPWPVLNRNLPVESSSLQINGSDNQQVGDQSDLDLSLKL
ncbi:zinc finger protein 3-like [Abeliophyllum distichum]|uniref:Zinc finger protein 3-like n=1 Tax=Abeliophyllum distichum TaxID=126358 RepID=A0ABD1QZQ8_9LAMI